MFAELPNCLYLTVLPGGAIVLCDAAGKVIYGQQSVSVSNEPDALTTVTVQLTVGGWKPAAVDSALDDVFAKINDDRHAGHC